MSSKVQEKKLSSLIHDDKNMNKHNQYGMHLLEKSVSELGLGRSILVDKNNRIIGGNGVAETAASLGLEDCIIVETTGDQLVVVKRTDVDLDSKKGRELALSDNAVAHVNLEWDKEAVAELSEQWNIKPEDWGVADFEFEEVENLEAEEDDFEAPEGGTETDIVLGDLFEIGEHRLLCGDSTCSDTVAKLMNGKKADMVFTDPPYLMDFKGNVSWDDKKGTQKTFNSVHGGIMNDKMSKKDGDEFLDAINSNIVLYCKGAFYITFYRLGIDQYFESLKRVGLQCRSLIIWNKLNHTLSNSDYMSRYEPIFYGWVNDHNFYGGNNGMDIWDIERTKKNELHPTMKPIPLIEKALSDGSKTNDIILDLFGGSGSTMVGSHQLKRKSRLMELDPKYCQVIVDRMIKLDPSIVIKKNGDPYLKPIIE